MYLFLEELLQHIYNSEFYNNFTIRDLYSYTVLLLLQIYLKNPFLGQEKKSSKNANAKYKGR